MSDAIARGHALINDSVRMARIRANLTRLPEVRDVHEHTGMVTPDPPPPANPEIRGTLR